MEKFPVNNQAEQKSVLEKLRGLKFAVPMALATFLASCEGPNAVSPDVAKNIFEQKPELERIDISNIENAKQIFAEFQDKLKGEDKSLLTNAMDFDGENIEVEWKNDSTVLITKNYDMRSVHDNADFNERASREIGSSDKFEAIGLETDMPANIYAYTFGKHNTTVKWGRGLSVVKESQPEVDDNQVRQFLNDASLYGSAGIDNETGGIVYFVDADNEEASFRMKEDGTMIVGTEYENRKGQASEFLNERMTKDFLLAQQELQNVRK
jgi:hypothetical protein